VTERETRDEAPRAEREVRREVAPESEVPSAADSWRRHREILDTVELIRERRRRRPAEI
jgi:hypothetical protein